MAENQNQKDATLADVNVESADGPVADRGPRRRRLPGRPRDVPGRGRQRQPGLVADAASTSRSWPSTTPVSNPMGGGLRLPRGVHQPRPARGEERHRRAADHLAGLVAGRLRQLRPVLRPDGLAQRRHLPDRRRPGRSRRRPAAVRTDQLLAGQRAPRPGSASAVAGEEEVRQQALVGRPDRAGRQRRHGVHGLPDLRLSPADARTSTSRTRTSTGVPSRPGSATSATPAIATSRSRWPRSRWD